MALAHERHAMLEEMIAAFPPRQQEVFRLWIEEEMTIPEIAEAMVSLRSTTG
jgi:DNA-directed RNA polymerase specialized sigma24 family protein